MSVSRPRVLFVLKNRPPGPPGSWGYSYGGGDLPSGMSVSVQQMITALTKLGIDAKAVSVQDNNFIHQEVESYDPSHVIVEGFWVVPDKFQILEAMSPNRVWIVRCHSNTEFLAQEGTVFGWALDYLERGVTVAFNSPTAMTAIENLRRESDTKRPGHVVFLPNYYDVDTNTSLPREWLQRLVIRHSQVKERGHFQVGCFGAIRPLKNHMNQALAALKVAKRLGLSLNFFVNTSRVEMKGDSCLSSLRSLFQRMGPHKLVEISWQEHDKFMSLLNDMDIVSQVSNSETFNIVLADAVACGIPVIGANIPWLDSEFQTDPNNVDAIARLMHHTWLKSGNETVQQRQRRTLVQYVTRSARLWSHYLRHSTPQHPEQWYGS